VKFEPVGRPNRPSLSFGAGALSASSEDLRVALAAVSPATALPPLTSQRQFAAHAPYELEAIPGIHGHRH
jgi:hypothetical protein